MKLDIVKIYYNWIIVSVVKNDAIQKDLGTEISNFASIKSFINEFKIEENHMKHKMFNKLHEVFEQYNFQIHEIFKMFASDLIKYAIKNGISLIERVKDSIKYSIQKYSERKSHGKIADQIKFNREKERKQNKILVFNPENDYLIQNSIGKSYFVPVPGIDDVKITFEQSVYLKNVITYGDSKPTGFENTETGWRFTNFNAIKNKFSLETLNEESITTTNKSWRKKRKVLETARSLDYKKLVLLSWKKRNKKFIRKDKNSWDKAIDPSFPKMSINEFDWEQATFKPEYLSQFFIDSEQIKLVCWNEFKTRNADSFPPEFQIWAERNFGSFVDYFTKNYDDIDERKIVINNITKRYSIIKYLWAYGIIDKVQGSEFLQSQIEFLSDFYSRDPLNRFRENVVGWQVSPRFSIDAIANYPFEALLRIQGAYPRLVALENLESLSSHPDMIKLQSFDTLLGWNSRLIKEFRSK